MQADGIGKAKQTLEMVGSALFVLPWLRHAGLILLALAVPLAYESVRRKVKRRVIYVDGADQGGNDACHKTLKFWMQARGMGSKLIVGVVGKEKTTDMVLNACACSAVDEVIAEVSELGYTGAYLICGNKYILLLSFYSHVGPSIYMPYNCI